MSEKFKMALNFLSYWYNMQNIVLIIISESFGLQKVNATQKKKKKSEWVIWLIWAKVSHLTDKMTHF